MGPSPQQFDFGANWQEYSTHALDAEKVAEARAAFIALLGPVDLRGRTFLDIGFGQGLGLLTAADLGARAMGCDINPTCAAVLQSNRRWFPKLQAAPPAVVGSILEPAVVEQIRERAHAEFGRAGFDIVHSWGVLHHTGDMARAVQHAASLVAPGGRLILAIYNRHWSSPLWRVIKRAYVSSPGWVQKGLVGLCYVPITLAKALITRSNPFRQERGMDFHYDVIDWVGGYPYEYASTDDVSDVVARLGFATERVIPARVPTGCNEFVFQRTDAPA